MVQVQLCEKQIIKYINQKRLY